MSFCRFADTFVAAGFTPVDNVFIYEYLPYAPSDYVKVYLYGLACCQKENTLETFAEGVNVPVDVIENAVNYWEEQGLVSVVSRKPLEIRYLPLRRESGAAVRKYKPEKYADFNSALQNLYPDRQLPPGEYVRYYEFAEDSGMQTDALLMIAKYCINLKGTSVRSQYVLAVARDWAADGVKSVEQVEDRLKEHEASTEATRKIFSALGRRSSPEFEDRQLYLKWTKSWGFDLESILYVCKLCKNKGGVKRVDAMLDEFFKLNIFKVEDMKDRQAYRDRLYALTKSIVSKMGLYYENLEYVTESYIVDWLAKGFEEDALVDIATYCFKRSIRTLEGMNAAVDKFYKQGRVTSQAIREYIDELIARDADIKEIIALTGSARLPGRSDRDYYNNWHDNWGFTHEVIAYVAGIASTKSQSFAYLNNCLARLYADKVFDVAAVKKYGFEGYKKQDASYKVDRDYTSEELGSFFADIDDPSKVEI